MSVNDAVFIAFFAGLPSIIAAIAAALALRASSKARDKATEAVTKVTDIHLTINSRMDELLKAATGQARAEGVAAGEQSQRDRAAEPQP